MGTIESNWRYSGDQVILEVTIPSNVIAEIRLPDGNTIHAETGIHVFSCKAYRKTASVPLPVPFHFALNLPHINQSSNLFGLKNL